MNSTVIELDDKRVKLTIAVDQEVIDKAVDAAFKEIAKEVRIPGFRPGKVPRRVLEARIGAGYAREQALRDALPNAYARAVVDNDVDPIAPPEIEITDGAEGGPVTFDAVVEVRPCVQVEGYGTLTIEVPSPELTDADIEGHVDRLRAQYGDLAPVERPASDGDHVTIDIEGRVDGEPVPGLTATDYDYRVGSGAVVPEIDENLRGASTGDTLDFIAPHPDPDEGGEIDFTIVVKGVKELVLPDADDQFASEASEFETLAELRESLKAQYGRIRRIQSQMAVRDKLAEALAALVTDEVPTAMVASEFNDRLNELGQRLQAQRIEFQQYLEVTGRSPEAFGEEMRTSATGAVRLDLALRAVATAEDLWPTDEDYRAEIETAAGQADRDADQLIEQFSDTGYEKAVRSDLAKRRAFDWLLENCSIVDPEGIAVSWDDLIIDETETDEDDDDAATDDAATDDAATDDPATDDPATDDTEDES